MNLGFIGTGKIASSVITGICTSKISFNKIIISPRNKSIAKNLKQKFKKVIIAKNNQQIVDKCDWIFLAVTPIVGEKIIKDLNIKCLLYDPEIKAKQVQVLSEGLNLKVYKIDILGNEFAPGQGLYFNLMKKTSSQLSLCLK